MNNKLFLLLSSVFLFIAIASSFRHIRTGNSGEPWTSAQLEAPAYLANIINDPKAKQPLVFCVGPGASIKSSIDIGPARDTANLAKFKLQLDRLPKDADIVIYCGCCPFEHCPNIRPAFMLLNLMKFTHHKLLNLEHNLKVDWIDKGYPLILPVTGRR
jgi:thiosulfate/3-mercaptopyruvate sulfurtransferase